MRNLKIIGDRRRAIAFRLSSRGRLRHHGGLSGCGGSRCRSGLGRGSWLRRRGWLSSCGWLRHHGGFRDLRRWCDHAGDCSGSRTQVGGSEGLSSVGRGRCRRSRFTGRAGRRQQQSRYENNNSTGQLTTPDGRLARSSHEFMSPSDLGIQWFSAHQASSRASVAARSRSGSDRFSSKRNFSAAPTSGPGPMP